MLCLATTARSSIADRDVQVRKEMQAQAIGAAGVRSSCAGAATWSMLVIEQTQARAAAQLAASPSHGDGRQELPGCEAWRAPALRLPVRTGLDDRPRSIHITRVRRCVANRVHVARHERAPDSPDCPAARTHAPLGAAGRRVADHERTHRPRMTIRRESTIAANHQVERRSRLHTRPAELLSRCSVSRCETREFRSPPHRVRLPRIPARLALDLDDILTGAPDQARQTGAGDRAIDTTRPREFTTRPALGS